jgi:hypothetical protein
LIENQLPVGPGARAFEMSGSLAQAASMQRSALPQPAEHQIGSSPYYLNDFNAVIDGVRGQYAELLNPAETSYLQRLATLSEPARMLYARLVNRKGPYFRVDRLAYPEIGDVEAAIAELADGAFLQRVLPTDTPAQVLACFTCPELKAALAGRHIAKSSRRAELLEWLSKWDGYGDWISGLLARHPIIGLTASDPFAFLRFLFFGELRQNLSDFVTRALGYIVTETVAPAALRPRFMQRCEIDDAYRMANLYQEFRGLREREESLALLEWWRACDVNREALSAGREWFDRLIDRLGRLLERAGQTVAAAALYASSPVAPARERRARLLIKSGELPAAMALLREMLANPSDAEEAYAARQLLARLERRSRRTEARDFEIAGTTLRLDYPPAGVEAAVLAHYRQQGWHGVHSENWLWNASFGLLLWDIIYDPALGVFHSPFQFAPSDLHRPDFYKLRRPRIEARLAMLGQPVAAGAVMRDNFRAKNGIANPFVAWHDDLPDLLDIMVRRLPAAGHAAALRHIAQNILRHTRGLPDLFLWNDSNYRFVEIKAENDHLSGHQFEWLRLLKEQVINVSLEKVQRGKHV